MAANIVSFSLDEEPMSLDELSADYPDNIEVAKNSYMQQLLFQAQLNIANYKE